MNRKLNDLWRRIPLGPRFLLSLFTMTALTPLLYVAERVSDGADLGTWHTPAALLAALLSALAFFFTMERVRRTLE